MSIRAITWAFEQQGLTSTQKLVLLKLADNANDDGYCWPSREMISKHTGLSISTISRTARKLADMGIVDVIPQSQNGVSLPNRYKLHMGAASETGVGAQEHGGSSTRARGVGAQEHTEPSVRTVNEPSEEEFDAWYAEYPRHQDKGHARRAYRKARKKADAESLLSGARKARKRYQDTEKQYIPLPATWLNGERWLDEDLQGDESSLGLSPEKQRIAMRQYLEFGDWPPWTKMPEPGQPGNRIEPEILREFGYGEAA